MSKRATPEELAAEARAWLDDTATLEGWDDAPLAVPRAHEATPISMRLPNKMLAILQEFARRKNMPYQTMMKVWLDDRIRTERDKLLQAKCEVCSTVDQQRFADDDKTCCIQCRMWGRFPGEVR